MKYDVLDYKKLGEIANTTRGLRLGNEDKILNDKYVRGMRASAISKLKEHGKLIELKDVEKNNKLLKCKSINFKGLSEMNDGNMPNSAGITYVINTERKNKKENIFIRKDDIVINTFMLEDKSNVILIEHEFPENYVYGELEFVIRVNKEILDPVYVYTILSSDYFQQHLLDVAIKGKAIKYRMTLEILNNIKIPILSEESKKAFYKEYNKKKKLEQELKKINEQFNNDIESIARLTK